MQVHPIFLALHPAASVTRDVKDTLYEFPNPQSAASYLFQTKPASNLSQNWDIIIVIDGVAYRFSIDGGVRLIPVKPQQWRTMKRENLNWRYPKIGFTSYSVEEITRKAFQISWPMKYSLYPETAQNFCHALYESIRLPTLLTKPTHILTSLPDDFLQGLSRVPSPVSTLFNRLKFVIFLTLLSFYQFVLGLISTRVFLPAKRLGAYMWGAMKLMKACYSILLFLGIVGMKLTCLMVVLVLGGDFGKAARDLRDLAEEVSLFDGFWGSARTGATGEGLIVNRKM